MSLSTSLNQRVSYSFKGLASYCKAETTFTFYFTILPLSRAFLSINNREMKSESGFSFAMASQPFTPNPELKKGGVCSSVPTNGKFAQLLQRLFDGQPGHGRPGPTELV